MMKMDRLVPAGELLVRLVLLVPPPGGNQMGSKQAQVVVGQGKVKGTVHLLPQQGAGVQAQPVGELPRVATGVLRRLRHAESYQSVLRGVGLRNWSPPLWMRTSKYRCQQ